MRSVIGIVLGLVLLTGGARAQSSPGLNEQPIVIYECPIQPFDDIRVPVAVGGILSEVNVKEGDKVTIDQLIAKVKDDKALSNTKPKRSPRRRNFLKRKLSLSSRKHKPAPQTPNNSSPERPNLRRSFARTKRP